MNRHVAIALVGAVALTAGLLLGFTGVGNDCGSALAPDSSQAQINDTFGNLGGDEADCRDAVSNRRPLAYGTLGVGALALLLAIALPTSDVSQKREN